MAETEMAVNVKQWETDCSNRMFEENIAELICVMKGTSCPGKEVFLKELISFSTTRLEVKEGERMDDDSAQNGGEELYISVLFDGEENRLTVEDSGIEIREDNLGMRPKQGTRALISSLKAGKDLSNIKLFDVGFFTVFAVADKITIDSTHDGRTELYTWKSSAEERGFSLKCSQNQQLECRTQIILDLKKDIAEKIKRKGLEKFLRENNCHSSYKIEVFHHSVINSSEVRFSEPAKEAAVGTKDVRKGTKSTPGTSQGSRNSYKSASKTKASSPTTAPAGSGPQSERLFPKSLPAPTQRCDAFEESTPFNAGQKPQGMSSAGRGPARAGISQGPTSGRSPYTPSPFQPPRFYTHSAGQMPPGMVSPASYQGPLTAGVSSGAVKTKSPDNQQTGTKRKSTGPSTHETPKSRKSTVSSDVSVVTNGKQNHVGKGTDTTFRDCTNLDRATPKTPGSAKTPGMLKISMASPRSSSLVSSGKFISTLESVKNCFDENATIAVKVMKQKEPGKEKSEADGKAWYRGSWEIVDSTDRAILKVYGHQDMKFFQPRQHLLLHNIWIREDHISLTKRSKVEEYKGEIKTVEGINKKRRSDEAKNRMTLEEIKSPGCKAAARLHICQVGDVHEYSKKDGSKSSLKKLQVKDQKNSRGRYELVTFHDLAGMQYEVNKRYHFPCVTYNREKGNFQTIGQTLPHIV